MITETEKKEISDEKIIKIIEELATISRGKDYTGTWEHVWGKPDGVSSSGTYLGDTIEVIAKIRAILEGPV